MQNLEKKKHMIMRDGKFATMTQHQEEDKSKRLTEKEQRAMVSTPTGKDLLIVKCVIYLYYFLQSSIT